MFQQGMFAHTEREHVLRCAIDRNADLTEKRCDCTERRAQIRSRRILGAYDSLQAKRETLECRGRIHGARASGIAATASHKSDRKDGDRGKDAYALESHSRTNASIESVSYHDE